MKNTPTNNRPKQNRASKRSGVREQRLARRTELEPSVERTETGGAERSGRRLESLPSLPHARKMLLDYMDTKRPWANCKDVYVAMEEIANYASYAFRSEHVPTKEEVAGLNRDLLRFTEALDSHPENYDGPCACSECRSYGD